MNTATLVTGYRGSKAHAVDASRIRSDETEAMSLCRWMVTVSELPFKDLGSITCRTCAKVVR